ncbi:hypothetical protein CTA1_456 [Colletotrichum tanaceti]|uniref:Uncharacterized protein n=1 Tax=Colletotrichum tanaceti TaxID=1306861 RepID=A0A4U6X7L0_9PEZI|nr:hypothetical protein CTA1_456 [Colletotrichum tanaceti]
MKSDLEHPAVLVLLNKGLVDLDLEPILQVRPDILPLELLPPIDAHKTDDIALQDGDGRPDGDAAVDDARLREEDGVKRLVRLREAHVGPADDLALDEPVGGAEDGLAVGPDPPARLAQVVGLGLDDGAVGARADVEQKVAVLGRHVDERVDDGGGVHVLLGPGGAVVAVAVGVHAAVALPLAALRRGEGLVLGGVEVGGLGDAAARVDGHLPALGPRPVPPGRREPGGAVGRPAVAPHDVRAVVVRERLHLRHHEVRHEVVDGHAAGVRLGLAGVGVRRQGAGPRDGRRRRGLHEAVRAKVRVEPLGQREVGAALQRRLVRGGGVEELAEQVPLGAVVDGGAVRGRPGVEEGEAVVVLGRDDEVLGAGVGEQVDPRLGVEPRGVEVREGVVVRPVGAVGREPVAVKVGAVALRVVGRVPPVPLGVALVGRRVAPARDGVGAPVDEDAELGVVEPPGALVPGEAAGVRRPRRQADVHAVDRDRPARDAVVDAHGDADGAVGRALDADDDDLLVAGAEPPQVSGADGAETGAAAGEGHVEAVARDALGPGVVDRDLDDLRPAGVAEPLLRRPDGLHADVRALAPQRDGEDVEAALGGVVPHRQGDGAQPLAGRQGRGALKDVGRVEVGAVGREAAREDHLAAVDGQEAEPVERAQLVPGGGVVGEGEGHVAADRRALDVPRDEERGREVIAAAAAAVAAAGSIVLRRHGEGLAGADDVVGFCGAGVSGERVPDPRIRGGELGADGHRRGERLVEGVEGRLAGSGAEGFVVEEGGQVEWHGFL